MTLFDDLITYELCFPGAVTGSTEVECPHCGELLTVPVDDLMGEESYLCGECGGVIDADWGEVVVLPLIGCSPSLALKMARIQGRRSVDADGSVDVIDSGLGFSTNAAGLLLSAMSFANACRRA